MQPMLQWKHLKEHRRNNRTERKGKAVNILFCSVGRRCELLKDFRTTMGDGLKIVVTDNSPVAPAMAFADKAYLVPLITDPSYISIILDICKKEDIQAVTTLRWGSPL